MESELNIVVQAIDDTEAAFGSISTGLGEVGESAQAMATTFDESVAELNAAMEEAGASATEMVEPFDAAMAEMVSSFTAADEAIVAELDGMLATVMADSEEMGASLSAGLGQAMVAAGVIFVGAIDEISDSLSAASKWDKTIAELNQELKNTGSSIPISELENYAKTVENNTLFSQQDVMGAEQVLMSHKELQGSYKDLTQAAADLATKTNTDLPTAMANLVKILNDPATATAQLKNAQIDLTAAQLRTIDALAKGGDTAGADTAIMKALNDQIGGLAESVNNTDPWQKLVNIITDAQRVIGNDLLPVLQELVKDVKPIIENIGDWAAAHPKLTAAILIATVALAGIVLAITTAMIIITAIGAAITSFVETPIAILIAAFLAVGAGVVFLYEQIKNNWGDIKTTIESVAGDVMDFIQGWYNKIIGWIENILNSIKSIPSNIGGGISGAIGGIGNFVTTHLAEGGIVSSPTVALIGEAGPEAVIPLSLLGSSEGGGLGNGGGGITVNINGTINSTENQATILGNMIAKVINRQLKLKSW